MAKLGVQLSDAQAEQQQQRSTRKDRVQQVQAKAKAERERIKFENLKAQAQEIQDTKFKDRTDTVDENYNIYRPSRFSAKEWNRMSAKTQAYHMKGYNRNISYQIAKRNVVVHNTATRQVQKVIPFTLEDVEGTADNSYFDIYDNLSPDLKQFFSTPDQVLKDKATRITTTKQSVADKLIDTDRRIAEVKEKYRLKIEKSEASWSRKSSSYRHKEGRKQRQKDRINGYEDDLDEAIAELQGFKKGLGKASGGLSKNQDLDYKDIESYAWDVGYYEKSKEKARNDNRNDFYDKVRSGELDEQFKQLGLDKNKPSYYGYKKSVDKYNKGVTAQLNLIAKGERMGFDKLSKAEQIKVNPQLAQWQWENKGEKLLFEGNTPTGIESASLQQSMSLTNYQKVTSPEYLKAQHNKKFAPKPVYDFASGGFQSEDPNRNIFGGSGKPSEFKVLTAGKELPVDYGHQGTAQFDGAGNFKAPTVVVNRAEYNKRKAEQGDPNLLKDALGGVVAGYGYINDRVNWDFKIGGSPSMPKLNVISFGKKDTKAEKYTGMPDQYLKDTQDKLDVKYAGQDNIDKLDLNLETKYSTQYQNEFEQKHMIDLIDGEIDFETASKQFANSSEAKGVQTRYQTEYNTEYKELMGSGTAWNDKGYLRKLGYGTAGFVLDVGKLVTTAVKTPLNLATTGVAVYTGVGLLKAVPPVAMNIGLAGLGIYGTSKFLDADSTYTEAGAGLVTAGLSFGTLGYAGVKYLKSPNVTRVGIKPPKMNLKVAHNMKLGKDYKIVKDGVTGANKVVYKAQKLSQQVFAGSRAEVSTKWRVLSNKYLGSNLNPIYKGVPTQQLGYTRDYGFFRSTTKSGYDQATNLLKKYGWTNAQAKATLRYSAPRVYEQWLNKGEILVKGQKATAYFEHLTKRPVLNVDKSLGIKTRGGADFKTITKSVRELIKDPQTKQIYAQYSNQAGSGFVNKAGKFKDWSSYKWTSGKTVSKATDVQKGFEYLGRQNGVDVWDTKSLYKDMVGISKDNTFSLKIAKTRANYNIDINLDPTKAKPQVSSQRLYQKIIDLDKGKNVWVKPTNIKKTPFPKYDQVDDIVKQITKVKPVKANKNVISDIMKKIDKVDDFKAIGGSQSKYYGKGGYDGGDNVGQLMMKQNYISPQHLTQNQIHQNQYLLKTDVVAPQMKMMDLKHLINTKHIGAISLIKLDTLTAIVGLKSLLKNEIGLKNNMKIDNLIKQDYKWDQLTQVKTVSAVKTAPLLKQQLKGMLDFDVGVPALSDPVFKTPKIPKIDYTYLPKPFVLPKLISQIKKKKGKGKKGLGDEAYLPDFTSRALGLGAETVTQKQANKKLKKLLTGLEIRRGVKIKG